MNYIYNKNSALLTWGATLDQFLIGPTETFLGDFIWIERLLKMIACEAQLATICWDR